MINNRVQKIALLVYLVFLCCLSQSNHLYYHSNPSPVEPGQPVKISQTLLMKNLLVMVHYIFEIRGTELSRNYDGL